MRRALKAHQSQNTSVHLVSKSQMVTLSDFVHSKVRRAQFLFCVFSFVAIGLGLSTLQNLVLVLNNGLELYISMQFETQR